MDPDSPADGVHLPTNNGEPNLIQLINNVQEKLVSSTGQPLNISLPQITVIGCEGAGKSSVLEKIVGREFLPRGENTVTRRPTVIQLHPCDREFAIFEHKKEREFTDFSEVMAEIEAETARHPGPEGFSSIPINLQIYSPNVLKLTLVDLPGLVKNAVGNQSENVVNEVQDMAMEYISKPRSLILAISPATQRIANSDALKFARSVDKDGERTIGVLTKLDLMQPGTHARDILENKVIHLKRGYIGVINRSQQDLNDKKTIDYILDKERRFFHEHPQYRHMASRMGTEYLKVALHKQLRVHIRATLPELRKELDEQLTHHRRELDGLSEKLGKPGSDKYLVMIKLVQKFVEVLNLQLLGQSEMADLGTLSGGAHINFIMSTEIKNYLNLTLTPDPKRLAIAIANISGVRTSISVPSLSSDAMWRILMEEFKVPVEHCVDTVAKELYQVVSESANEVKEYRTLYDHLIDKVDTFISKQVKVTKEILRNHVEAEMNYINLAHPDLDFSKLMSNAPPTGPIALWNEEISIHEDTEEMYQSLDATGLNTAETTTKDDAAQNSETSTKDSAAENAGTSAANSTAKNDETTTMHRSVQNIKKSRSDNLLGRLMSSAHTQHKVEYVSRVLNLYMGIVKNSIYDLTVKYIMFYLIKQVIDFVSADLQADLKSSGNVNSLMMECEDDIQRQKHLEEACDAVSYARNALYSF